MDKILQLLEISFEQFMKLENLNELENFDSILHMNLVLTIEEQLNRKLTIDEMMEILNPQKLKKIL